jgi:hypothetical protein
MVMRMLAEGGFPLLCDARRPADRHNPFGYFEYEPVKGIASDGSWLALAEGRAVKIVVPLLMELPNDRPYALLFIGRNPKAVLRSQNIMLGIDADTPPSQVWLDRLISLEAQARRWCRERQRCPTLPLRYESVLAEPAASCRVIQGFLGRRLDLAAMAAAVAGRETPSPGLAASSDPSRIPKPRTG